MNKKDEARVVGETFNYNLIYFLDSKYMGSQIPGEPKFQQISSIF